MENFKARHLKIKHGKKMENLRKIAVLLLLLICFKSFSLVEIKKYFTVSEIKKANTALKATYLTQTERDVFMVLNLARLFPKKFLVFYTAYAKDNAGSDVLKTNPYYTSLTKTLQKMKPTHAFLPNAKMWQLAKCWAIEAGEGGIVGHNRTQCKEGYSAECCTYGNRTAVEIVMSFLIDKDVESLGHREACLSEGYNQIGVSQQAHKTWRTNTVIDFTHKNDLASK